VDRDDGIAAVVLAPEHLLDLGGVHLGLQLVEAAVEVLVDGLALIEPLADDGEVVGGGLQLAGEVHVLAEAATPLEHALGLGLVAPEVGCGDALFEPGDFLLGASGLKDNSAGRRPAS
jgi:hypothetical protein